MTNFSTIPVIRKADLQNEEELRMTQQKLHANEFLDMLVRMSMLSFESSNDEEVAV